MKKPTNPILEIAKIFSQIHPELNEDELFKTYIKVAEHWEKQANKFSKPVKFLIIGEATQNLGNYFYNELAKITPFLTPSHFNCSSKDELIIKLMELNALIFDLYPLPLATTYYDKSKVKHSDKYQECMNEYFKNALLGKVDKDTIIVVRYSKLIKRKEWRYFEAFWKEFVSENGCTIKFIYGNGFFADGKKIEDIFMEPN